MPEERPELPKTPQDIEDENPGHEKWRWSICGGSPDCDLNDDPDGPWCKGPCGSGKCLCVPIRYQKGVTLRDPDPKWRRFPESKEDGKKNRHKEAYWYACVCVHEHHLEKRD